MNTLECGGAGANTRGAIVPGAPMRVGEAWPPAAERGAAEIRDAAEPCFVSLLD